MEDREYDKIMQSLCRSISEAHQQAMTDVFVRGESVTKITVDSDGEIKFERISPEDFRNGELAQAGG